MLRNQGHIALFVGVLLCSEAAAQSICDPLPGVPAPDPTRDLCETYEKPGSFPPWGDIFSRFYNHSEFARSHALVIGVGDYEHWSNLEAPLNDALRVRDFLVDDAGFDRVVVLTNRMASKVRIERLMEEVFPQQVGANDRFIFYFSGHGTQRPIGTGRRGYLVLKPASERGYADMISMGNIQRWADNLSHTRHGLFLLDACFSGLAGDQRKGLSEAMAIDRLAQYGHHLVSAGTEDEESVAVGGASLFTSAFLRAAWGSGDSGTNEYPNDGVVSLKELTEYIGRYLDNEIARLNAGRLPGQRYRMTPQISHLRPDNAGEFFFISKAHKNREAHLPEDHDLAYGLPEGKGTAPAPSVPYGGRDAAVFAIVRDSAIAADFEQFVEDFPLSPLVPYAENRLAALSAPRSSPPPEPELETKQPAPEFVVEPADLAMVVTAGRRVNVRDGPGTEFDRVGSLDDGQEVEVIGQVEGRNWYHVRLPDGTRGFVHAGLLGETFVNERSIATVTPAAAPAGDRAPIARGEPPTTLPAPAIAAEATTVGNEVAEAAEPAADDETDGDTINFLGMSLSVGPADPLADLNRGDRGSSGGGSRSGDGWN